MSERTSNVVQFSEVLKLEGLNRRAKNRGMRRQPKPLHRYLKERPVRPYSLESADLVPDLQIAVLNTNYTGLDRLRYARNLIIASEVFVETLDIFPLIRSSFVAARQAEARHLDQDNINVISVPLTQMGIECDPYTKLFDTHAYTVPHTAILEEADLVLNY